MSPDDPIGVIGTTVDKYRIDAFAGEGGFSVVYRAEHTIWKEPVAIKFLVMLEKAPETVREVLLEDFVNEGKLMTRLSSKSSAIVQARDVGRYEVDGDWIPYMVLEWVDGEALDDRLEREAEHALPPRSLPEILTFLAPVAEAVASAHDAGVAHRDLKPANIMIVENGGMKVLDFGIAKVMEGGGLQDQLEKTSHVVNPFSPAYGAPEQFSRRNGATGPWTDVFALALIIIEMLQNQPVLMGSLYDTAEISCNSDHRPTPRQLGLTVSDEVEAVFAKALAVNVADRYKSMREFWNDLYLHVVGELPISDSAFTRSLVPTPVPSSPRAGTIPIVDGRMAPMPSTEPRGPSSPPFIADPPTVQSAVHPTLPEPRTPDHSKWMTLGGIGLILCGALAAVALLGTASNRETTAVRTPSEATAPVFSATAAASTTSATSTSSAAASQLPASLPAPSVVTTTRRKPIARPKSTPTLRPDPTPPASETTPPAPVPSPPTTSPSTPPPVAKPTPPPPPPKPNPFDPGGFGPRN